MNRAFQIAAGTVTGQHHLAAGRNNQDAYAFWSGPEGMVAVVCDGCSGGANSEVGAKLGARLLVHFAASRLGQGGAPAETLEEVRRELVARLRSLAAELAVDRRDGRCVLEAVCDTLLFTVVGLMVTRGWAAAFSLGDGLMVLNGERRLLGPFPGNAPPYLGYALIPWMDEPVFQVDALMSPDALDSALLGTDGVIDLEALSDRPLFGREEPLGPLSQFWDEDRFFENRDGVRRRLAVAARGPRGSLLPDDTTLLVMRRRRGEA